MNSKHREDEWQDLAPSLAKMEKKNPYLVPDGYFESLQSRIEQKVNSARPERSGFNILPMWTKYAAAACLTIAMGITLYLNLNQQTPTVNWAEIPEQEIVSYLEIHLDDNDTQLLFDQLNTQQTNIRIENINNQDLENYLNQQL
jgi:hypothetical protein